MLLLKDHGDEVRDGNIAYIEHKHGLNKTR